MLTGDEKIRDKVTGIILHYRFLDFVFKVFT